MTKVALVRCEDYDPQRVRAAVERGLELLGGASQFIRPEEKILLKPNLLAADPPEKCTTTHPAVFQAVAEAFIEAGAKISYGDSPAMHSPENAAKKAGLFAVGETLGIPLADFTTAEEIHFAEGLEAKRISLAKGVLEADGIISLPKLKTHALSRMTGCIKNQFGCIPGTRKAEYHARYPDAHRFCQMLVDLNSYLKPRLFIMDGIIAMEGNGPRGGNPKQMHLILLSTDPIALDATVCRLVGLDPTFVPTINYGSEAGLGTYQETEITLVGDPFEMFLPDTFDVKRKPVPHIDSKSSIALIAKLFNFVLPRPRIKGKCVQCGVCVQACPATPKALQWEDRSKDPKFNYNRCIRCYCCQELCPQSAIAVHEPLLRRLLIR